MRKILLLCLLGLSSTSFAKTQSVLEQFFPRKTIDQNELQKKIEIAQKYVTPDNIQKIVQESFDAHKETLEKLDLSKETLQGILDSICKEIILYSIRLDQKVSPLGLTFSLLKDAEKALKDENFALARLYTDLVVSIEHSSLGSQFVQIKEGQNLESIDQIATIASLCHTYAILGLIKNKQIKNENNKNFVDIDNFSSNAEIKRSTKEYIQALYELIGIRFQNNLSIMYKAFDESELETSLKYSLIIPQLLNIFNKNNLFDKEEYFKNQEKGIYAYINLERNTPFNWTINPDKGPNRERSDRDENESHNKKFCKLLKDKEWYDIAKKPPIGISTPLMKQYSKDKAEELYKAIENLSNSKEIAEKIQNFKKEYPIVLDFSEFGIFETIVENLKEENEIIKIFEQFQKSKDIIINKEDDSLYYAFLHNKIELAKYLIDHGFNMMIPLNIDNTYEEALFKFIKRDFWDNDKNLCYSFNDYKKLQKKYDLLSKNLIQLKTKEEKLLNISSLLEMIKDEVTSLKFTNDYDSVTDQTLYLLWFEKLYSVYYEENKKTNNILQLGLAMVEEIEEKIGVIDSIIKKKKNETSKKMWQQFKDIWEGAKNTIAKITNEIIDSK